MSSRPWAVALLLVACGGDSLTGSLSELIPLEVSRAEVYRNDEALQISYYRNRGVFLDVVARVTVYVKDVELELNQRLPLGGEWREGSPRTSVGHAPGGEPLRMLPKVRRGDLVLTEGGVAGGPSAGNFAILFEESGGDFGFGRTLNGSFAVKETVDAGFGPLP